MSIVAYCIYGLSTCVVAIAFHELGHYITLRVMGIKPKLEIEWWLNLVIATTDLPPRPTIIVYTNGILAGLIPFAMLDILFLPFVVIYLYGCKYDIRKIMKQVRLL